MAQPLRCFTGNSGAQTEFTAYTYSVPYTKTYASISKPSQFYWQRAEPSQMEFIQILFEVDVPVDPVATQRHANRQLRD